MVRVITEGPSIVDPEKAVSPMMRYFNSKEGMKARRKSAKPLTRREIVREESFEESERPVPISTVSSEVFGPVSSALIGAGMTKPVYADCWKVGSGDDLRILEKYSMPLGDVTIGLADDGEIEYNLTPKDYGYGRELTQAIGGAIESVRDRYRKKGGMMDRQSVTMAARESLCRNCPDSDDVSWTMDDLCGSVYRYTLGLGIFDVLLCDDRIEDIYVDAPCDRNRVHITMNRVEGFNSHIRCRTNLILEPREIRNLISRLKKETGLPFCESSPVLETDMADGCARVTIVGYPMSPNGDSVAIRKHSAVPWTLTRLVANDTITPYQAGLLSFLVANRSTFIIGGARGAGKSSLLSAMMFEFQLSQRILVIEDTIELPFDAGLSGFPKASERTSGSSSSLGDIPWDNIKPSTQETGPGPDVRMDVRRAVSFTVTGTNSNRSRSSAARSTTTNRRRQGRDATTSSPTIPAWNPSARPMRRNFTIVFSANWAAFGSSA